MILGSRREGAFDAKIVQLYAGLAELTTTAIEKAQALQRMEKRLVGLETINRISQAVSIQTDINELYQVVHNEVNQIMGGVNFAVADYDVGTGLIRIPYMYDGVDARNVDPFPLGEGLTSILIRTRQPLMLVEDAERKTRELGAKLVGKPAQSWLGVPLLAGGEAIGAIIVQDLEQEGRFDEDDQRLLEIIAAQVAVAVRNAHLLESIRHRAERERLLYDITSKIRSSPDMQTILATTATELGKVIGAQRTVIEIGIESEQALPEFTPDSEQELPDQPSDPEAVTISREEGADNLSSGDSP